MQKHFSWTWRKNNKTFCQKKVLGCSKVLFLAFLNTLKLFFGKMFCYFLSQSWQLLLLPFLAFFYKTKRTFCQQQFFFSRYLNIGLKKSFFSMSVQKTVFLSRISSKNLQKIKFVVKKMCQVIFFPIKIECIGFWEHSVGYQRTLKIPNVFFVILNCLFAINLNPVIELCYFLVLSGTVWCFLVLSGTFCHFLVLSMAFWYFIVPSGNVWYFLVLSCSFWYFLVLSDNFWHFFLFLMVFSGTLWYSLPNWATFWFFLVLSNMFLVFLVLYYTFWYFWYSLVLSCTFFKVQIWRCQKKQ